MTSGVGETKNAFGANEEKLIMVNYLPFHYVVNAGVIDETFNECTLLPWI